MSCHHAVLRQVHRFARDPRGVTIVEYALIVSLISIAIGFMIPEIRDSLDTLFLQTASGLGNAATQSQPPAP